MMLPVLIMSASCNMPGRQAEGSPTPDVTQAYQTVQARLTEAALQTPLASPTIAPSNTPAEASPTNTVQASNTAVPPTKPPTTIVKQCDQAEAGVPIDVTIPDDTQFAPGQSFTKVWRLRNSGTCTWSKNYSIAVFSGEPMSAPNSVPLPKPVEPGQTVDISVDLVAPNGSGTYQGNWKLKNEAGTWFGIGPGGSSPFWVRIVVTGGTITVTVTGTPGTPTYTATTQANPPLLVSGSNTMVSNDRLNLDFNTLNSGGGDDISLQPNAQDRLIVTTIGNAGMAGFGTSAPSFSQCQTVGVGVHLLRRVISHRASTYATARIRACTVGCV